MREVRTAIDWVNSQICSLENALGCSRFDDCFSREPLYPFYKNFTNESSGSLKTVYFSSDIIVIADILTGRRGVARRNPEDDFNMFVGLAIAWARYCGVEVPDNINVTEVMSAYEYEETPTSKYFLELASHLDKCVCRTPAEVKWAFTSDMYANKMNNIIYNIATDIIRESDLGVYEGFPNIMCPISDENFSTISDLYYKAFTDTILKSTISAEDIAAYKESWENSKAGSEE